MSSVDRTPAVDVGNSTSLRSFMSPGGKTTKSAGRNIEKCSAVPAWVQQKMPILWPICATTLKNKQRAVLLSTSKGAGMTEKDKKDFIADWNNL
jgi:hypothetical protein